MAIKSHHAGKLFLAVSILFHICSFSAQAQVTTGSFVVNGSINNYYPVTFHDGAWGTATQRNTTAEKANERNAANNK